jgi:hypothetical protein
MLGLGLLASGLFALFLAATGQFLPHDEKFLGMTARRLCSLHGCRIVHFMVHDRLAFGGALTAVGLVYLWLVASPLRQGRAWAWWLLLVSGTAGFASFLAYLGYGYLDTRHGVATLGLLPCFVLGLARSRALLLNPAAGIGSLLKSGVVIPWSSAYGVGRACLLVTAVGMVFGGLTILVVERLRQTELERAAAEARAVEERRRRRVQLALTGAVLLTLAGGGAWYVRQQRLERQQEEDRAQREVAQAVDRDLAEVAERQGEARWPEAWAALERAEGRLGASGPAEPRQRVAAARRRLEQIRTDRETTTRLEDAAVQLIGIRGH